MLKLKFVLLLFISIGIDVYAQKLTPEEKTVFDEIVYHRKKIGDYETLTKWVKPIRYKIYGDTSSYLVKEVDSFFNLIKKTTNYDIKKVGIKEKENFTFVLPLQPEDFKFFLNTETPVASRMTFFKTQNAKNEIDLVKILINTNKFKDRISAKSAVKRIILKCLGFHNDSKLMPNSVFNLQSNNNFKIERFDLHVISTLYLPSIKPGMTADEVDKILNP